MSTNTSVSNSLLDSVRTIEEYGKLWYCAIDIGYLLDLKNVRVNLQEFDKRNKRRFSTGTQSGEQKLTYIDKIGVARLLCNSRSSKVHTIAQHFGIDVYSYHFECKETSFVRAIEKSFPTYKIIRQYPLCGNNIDLIFSGTDLAVEFDEKYHRSTKQQEEDKTRQEQIN